jgi:hypothetical protein
MANDALLEETITCRSTRRMSSYRIVNVNSKTGRSTCWSALPMPGSSYHSRHKIAAKNGITWPRPEMFTLTLP